MQRGSAATRHREAQGGKDNFGQGKGRKRDRKEGGKAVGKGEKERKKESIKRIIKKSVCDECIRIYTNNISHIGSKNTILL